MFRKLESWCSGSFQLAHIIWTIRYESWISDPYFKMKNMDLWNSDHAWYSPRWYSSWKPKKNSHILWFPKYFTRIEITIYDNRLIRVVIFQQAHSHCDSKINNQGNDCILNHILTKSLWRPGQGDLAYNLAKKLVGEPNFSWRTKFNFANNNNWTNKMKSAKIHWQNWIKIHDNDNQHISARLLSRKYSMATHLNFRVFKENLKFKNLIDNCSRFWAK